MLEITGQNWNLILKENNGNISIKFISDIKLLKKVKTKKVFTLYLLQTIISEAAFDNSDGTDFVFDSDFWGEKRDSGAFTPGPFENKFIGSVYYGKF